MIKKYKKKPVVIEAVKWNGYNKGEISSFMDDKGFYFIPTEVTYDLVIKTLEGDHKANIGDYIIKGVKGEFYPCKPDIFEMTYEEAYVKYSGDFGGKRYGAELLDNARLIRSILSLEAGRSVCVSSYEKDVILKVENTIRRVNNG